MRRTLHLFVAIIMLAAFCNVAFAKAARETVRITCWEGYADKAFVKEYKDLIKRKYKIDVAVKTHYPKDQDEFYMAAKGGTADLISPPADLAKTPRFNCFEQGKYLLAALDLKNIPNARHMIPFFMADKSLTYQGKRYGLPYNCGPYGLDYNTEVVKEAPTSWNVFWDEQYKGSTRSTTTSRSATSGSPHFPWATSTSRYSTSKNWIAPGFRRS
jgi:putative spermidine/putrescine transport system substrate-binding protein